ncbi:tetratricopeptide repeat protein [Nostoc sp. TCL240-02]|uniref:tetratricopeptide repeat protein n=1 Tax=Nostoc sp. TCL240-02 TaxID=2572090 RepID=UPI00157F835B|nr:tetratricopeptide repeat protein [Nostoc sp. TCL240-02]QKQ74046.1 tetratricopeptide repeat protein [Nostoc sp. TCL240-02]
MSNGFYNNRGILYADQPDGVQRALADFNRAIALDPEYVESYFNRGLLKEAYLNDKASAIADIRQAARIRRKLSTACITCLSSIKAETNL